MKVLTLCCLVLLVHHGSSRRTVNDSIRLRKDLLDKYMAVMPLCTQGPVDIAMDIYLYMVVHFDEVQEIITLNGWYDMYWTDCKLRWNLTDYNDLSCIEFPFISHLWTPDITWLERIPYVKAFEFQDGIFTGARAFPCYDGRISISRQLLLKSFCSIDLTLFPFDTQRCPLTFLSWMHPYPQLTLSSRSGIGNVSFAVLTGTWDVLGMPVYPHYRESYAGLNYTALRYELIIQRLSLFYVFYLLLPAVFISMLIGFVFYLPPQSQEKLGFILSVVVAITVFMLLMVDITPQNARIPILSAYLFTVFVLASLSAAVTVIVEVAYEHHPLNKVPKSIRRIFLEAVGSFSFFRPTETQLVKHKSKSKGRRPETLTTNHKCLRDPQLFPAKKIELVAVKYPACSETVFTTATSIMSPDAVNLEGNTQQILSSLASQDTLPDSANLNLQADAISDDGYSDWWRVAFALDRILFLLYIVGSAIVLLVYVTIILVDQSVNQHNYGG